MPCLVQPGRGAMVSAYLPARNLLSSPLRCSPCAGIMNEQEMLRQKLAALKSEHRDLDDVIARLVERAPFDQLQMQRLKKRKLWLKDQIAHLESRLLPDIIA